jgi:hypothetical protein
VAVLVGASFLLLPSWLTEWLPQATQYSGYTRIGSPVWVITNYYFTFLGDAGQMVITLLMLAIMLWAWFPVLWRRDQSSFNWSAALTLTITHLILLRTATPHFVVYVYVIVFFLRELYRAGKRQPRPGLYMIGAMFVITASLWWLVLATLVNRFEHPVVYLPVPFGSLVLLLLFRQRWIDKSAVATPITPLSASPTVNP